MQPDLDLVTKDPDTHDAIVIMNRDLILYMGPTWDRWTSRVEGVRPPATRKLGSLTIYVSFGKPSKLRIEDGPWQEDECVIVRPYISHQIVRSEGYQATFLLEPETLLLEGLPLLNGGEVGAAARSRLSAGLRELHSRLRQAGAAEVISPDFCQALALLPKRSMDPRIEQIVNRMKQEPCGELSARQCASKHGLTVCGLTHLFKEETGTTFRRFRAWKRARSLIERVRDQATLTRIAMDSGYPDLTHFSHSARQIHGLTPTTMHAVANRITYYGGVTLPSSEELQARRHTHRLVRNRSPTMLVPRPLRVGI